MLGLSSACASGVDDDVLAVGRHFDGFGLEGAFNKALAISDSDVVIAGLDAIRLTPGLARAQIKEPAMPWGTDDFTRAVVFDFARLIGCDESGDNAVA